MLPVLRPLHVSYFKVHLQKTGQICTAKLETETQKVQKKNNCSEMFYLDGVAGLLGDALQGDDDLEGRGQDVPRGHVIEDALAVDLVRYRNRPEIGNKF